MASAIAQPLGDSGRGVRGRAYEAAIIAGDQGLAGSAELAWQLARFAPASLRASEVYAFGDGGQTRQLVRLAVQAHVQTPRIAGRVGVRIAVTRRAVIQIEADRGLLNPVATEDHESWRAVFSVRSSF